MTKKRKGGTLVAGAIVLAGLTGGVSAQAKQELPQVSGPIVVTPTSRPFLGSGDRYGAQGYVEEEFFISGTAYTYDWVGKTGHRVKVVAGPGPYVTRILVRRPRDPARFSGNVEVNILNASLGVDLGGPADTLHFADRGDVWIGITSKALSAGALEKFDPERYRPLDWSNPAPPALRCDTPSIVPSYMLGGKEGLAAMAKAGMQQSLPGTEDGLIWDMIGQLGQLLKSEDRSRILPGFSKPWLYMTGTSQSAIYLRTWLAGFHSRYRTADRKPVFDGYLAIVGPALARINQCAQDTELDDPRQKMILTDAHLITLSSEGEMWLGRHTRQPDAYSRSGGIVTYEVTGGSHRAGETPGLPADMMGMSLPDMVKSGVNLSIMNPSATAKLLPPGTQPSDFAWAPVVRGAYHNLQEWVRKGVRPPRSQPIALNSELNLRRDDNGIAIGGMRLPYIDVPIAAYTGFLTPGGQGGVMGAKRPFSAEQLRAAYGNNATYLARFSASANKLADERWISQEDAEAMSKAATTVSWPQ
jgi:Alpha/beta hydrolase domain